MRFKGVHVGWLLALVPIAVIASAVVWSASHSEESRARSALESLPFMYRFRDVGDNHVITGAATNGHGVTNTFAMTLSEGDPGRKPHLVKDDPHGRGAIYVTPYYTWDDDGGVELPGDTKEIQRERIMIGIRMEDAVCKVELEVDHCRE